MTPIAPIDPSVKIPAGVLAAAARADELHKTIYAAEPPPAPTLEPAPEAGTEAPAAEAPPAEAKAPEPVTPEVAQPAPVSEENWERRYKAMKGRYDAEVPRLKTQVQELGEEIAQLRQALAAAKMAPSGQPAPELPAERLITPEEEADYGTEFLAVVGKRAQEIVAPYLNKIKELESRLSGVGEVVVQDARSRMFSYLDDKIPNWQELNTNQNFLQWLQLPDLYSGVKRQELLEAAYERNDTPRVAAFFSGFLSQEAVVSPAKNHPAAVREPQVPLETLAAPGRAKSAAATSAPAVEKPIFTRAEITRFYADVASGKYRGREADKNRIEAQIFEADREGRIR